MDIVAERTDPRLVRVALDTYWAYAGGQDPVALIGRWRDRSGYYHAKDGNEHGVTELGKGRIAMGAFLAGALRAPVEWVVVEQDTPDPAPAEASRRIRRHVAGLELGVPLGRRPPPEAPQADARR